MLVLRPRTKPDGSWRTAPGHAATLATVASVSLLIHCLQLAAQGSASADDRSKANFLAVSSNFRDWPDASFLSPRNSNSGCVGGAFPFATFLAKRAREARFHGRAEVKVSRVHKDESLQPQRTKHVA